MKRTPTHAAALELARQQELDLRPVEQEARDRPGRLDIPADLSIPEFLKR